MIPHLACNPMQKQTFAPKTLTTNSQMRMITSTKGKEALNQFVSLSRPPKTWSRFALLVWYLCRHFGESVLVIWPPLSCCPAAAAGGLLAAMSGLWTLFRTLFTQLLYIILDQCGFSLLKKFENSFYLFLTELKQVFVWTLGSDSLPKFHPIVMDNNSAGFLYFKIWEQFHLFLTKQNKLLIL